MPATVGCPKCQFDYSAGAAECPRCGVVFEKYFRQQNSVTAEPIQPASGALHPIFGSWKLLVRVIGSVVVIAVAYGRPWLNSGRNEAEQHQSAPELAAVADEHGFVQLPSPEGYRPNTVYVVAAVNCPEEDAQRADRLTKSLADQRIPALRTSNASFNFVTQDPQIGKRIEAVMNGPLPIVFVRGRAKNNPSLDDVLAEYNKLLQP